MLNRKLGSKHESQYKASNYEANYKVVKLIFGDYLNIPDEIVNVNMGADPLILI
jgi:hypothetical protein